MSESKLKSVDEIQATQQQPCPFYDHVLGTPSEKCDFKAKTASELWHHLEIMHDDCVSLMEEIDVSCRIPYSILLKPLNTMMILRVKGAETLLFAALCPVVPATKSSLPFEDGGLASMALIWSVQDLKAQSQTAYEITLRKKGGWAAAQVYGQNRLPKFPNATPLMMIPVAVTKDGNLVARFELGVDCVSVSSPEPPL